jgi:murein L,D-transpeptidase YcbB/YkuD
MRSPSSLKLRLVPLLLCVVLLSSCRPSSEKSPFVPSPFVPLDPLIEGRINRWKTPSAAVVGQEEIYSALLVEEFYKKTHYEPAWVGDGHMTEADTLQRAVDEAYFDGLTPDYYHSGPIRSLANKLRKDPFADPGHMADLDILLTDAFITLGCHLSGGCVNPVTLQAKWFAKQGTVDVASVLREALKRRQVREALVKLRPDQEAYGRLKRALARYREMALRGERPMVSSGSLLREGVVSGRVIELRRRLAASGDLETGDGKKMDIFDERLEQSVIAFQRRHGLKSDGIVGPDTLDALNVPLNERIRQIAVNMERLRWILGNEEQRSIVVNIADFELNVIENQKAVLSMKVVVGKPYLSTPVFTSKLKYILTNPPWNIPESIARDEILKHIKKDPDYLIEQDIKVLKGWGAKEIEIEPETVNWSKVTSTNLPYRFRQEPGPLNPLGRIKFVLPNKYDVYLHDTPARQLFSQDIRAFSHGCIRVEKPLELAEYLLRGDPEWTRERLSADIKKGDEQKIVLRRPLNVHFLYLTAWVDGTGTLQFRKDIYGRDRLLDEALSKKPFFD